MKTLSRLCFSLLLVAALSSSSCGRSDPATTPTRDKSHLATLHLQLVDPDYIQDFSFSADGGGTAAIGDKAGVTPIIFYWQVSHGRLVLSTTDSQIDELSLVSESDEYIVARSKSGKVLTYRKLGR